MLKQIKEAPNDARTYLFYGSILSRINTSSTSSPLFAQGMTYLEKAQQLSPKKQTILFEIGSAYLNAKQFDKAVTYFKQAFELDESYPDARFYYALSLAYANDAKDSDIVLAPLAGTDLSVDARLIKAYYDIGQPAKVVSLLQAKLKLAQLYASQGKKNEAIAQVQEVISINPNFKAQGEALIAQIQKM